MQIDKIDLSRVNIGDVDNKITSLANVAAKTNIANTFTTNQTITGQLLLNGNITNPLKIVKDNDTWFGWYANNGTTRRAYFGFPVSGNNIELKNETNNANISLTTSGTGVINLTGNVNVSGTLTARNTLNLGTSVRIGYGGSPTIEPDDASNKTLNFQRFDINMNNKKITGVATPTANNDVANKAYVDNKALKKNRIEPRAFNVNTEHSLFTPTANQSVVSINMYRKRNDGIWFLIGGSDSSQILRKNLNGPFIFYPTSVSGYTNEYFFEIYYME